MKLHPKSIGELTMYQFSSILQQLGKQVNWDLQIAGLPLGGKIDQKYHPFSPSGDRQKEIRRKTQGSLSSFVDRFNKQNTRGR